MVEGVERERLLTSRLCPLGKLRDGIGVSLIRALPRRVISGENLSASTTESPSGEVSVRSTVSWVGVRLGSERGEREGGMAREDRYRSRSRLGREGGKDGGGVL